MPRPRLSVDIVAARILSAAWATWAWSTVASYWRTEPTVLGGVEAALHLPLWSVWMVVAILLTLGTVVPPSSTLWVQRTGMLLRGIGMCIAAGLLALWAREFLGNDMDRGWVSAKNYMLLCFGALFSAWFVVKGTRPPEEDADG